MKNIVTLADLATAIGKKTNVKAWEKGDKKRLYFQGVGYNTKKMTTNVFIEVSGDAPYLSVRINCPSQPYSWIASQEAEVKEQMQKYVRYCRRFFNFGTSGQSAEIVMNNALLDAEEVQGFTTEWRNVRVSINRFGKLADRNQQFIVPFKGTKANVPRTFVPLIEETFNWLVAQGEIMLEPYAPLPNLDERAAAYARYEQAEADRKEKARLAAEQEAADKLIAQKEASDKIAVMVEGGTNIVSAWKAAGCPHPAPAEIVVLKKESGLNWKQFIAAL